MHKEVRQLIREVRKKGWSHEHRPSGHVHLIAPEGGFVCIALSPSDHRWIKNARSDIRKIEKGIYGKPRKH